YLIEGGENGSNTSTPGGVDVVKWLLGILDKISDTGIVKYIGGVLGEVLDAIGLYSDINNCGFAFAIAKYFAGIFITIGAAFLLLPFLALMLTLSLAIWMSFFVAGVLSSFFSSQWSCKE
ncbi:hypothetical protein, partial [Alcanivorax sp. HI0083]